MPAHPIAITGVASISASGFTADQQQVAFTSGQTKLSWSAELETWVGRISDEGEQELARIKAAYPRLDRSVLLAIYAAEQAVQQTSWSDTDDYGIQLGSSRGATDLWENSYEQFREEGRVKVTTSPLTTLGNISSWVGQHLGQQGWRAAHSVTCSTAAHAIVQAVAWLRSGMAERFLAGGAEAPLTSFTLAQMRALRIYTKATKEQQWPSLPYRQQARNAMVLGEGAVAFCLERAPAKTPLGWLKGVGFAQEAISSPTSVDATGKGIAAAMQRAMQEADIDQVDLIVTHSPGTSKGDAAELAAIQRLFPDRRPALTNTKWLQGHCLGTSAGLSLELALLALRDSSLARLPYDWEGSSAMPSTMDHVLVNSLGFGGNCVSLLIGR